MYAKTQNRRNGRGQAVALDLVRAVCGGVGRLARDRLREAGLDPCAVGGGWFADYLVTDDEAGYPFRNSREIYVSRLEYDYTTTSGSWCYAPHIRYGDEAGGAIDAPKWIAAGCMSSKCSEYVGVAVLRAGS